MAVLLTRFEVPALMLQHVHYASDCLIRFCPQLLYHVCHFLSQLLLKRCEVCWGDHVCSLLLPLLLLLQGRAWPRSFASVSARGVAQPRSASMSNATLFCVTLEPTRMLWDADQVRMTSLETREANAQECNGVKSVYNSTETETEREKRETRERRESRERPETSNNAASAAATQHPATTQQQTQQQQQRQHKTEKDMTTTENGEREEEMRQRKGEDERRGERGEVIKIMYIKNTKKRRSIGKKCLSHRKTLKHTAFSRKRRIVPRSFPLFAHFCRKCHFG